MLTKDVADRLEHPIEEKADELDLDILRLEIPPDHVHLVMTGNPRLVLNEIIQQVKSYTSRNLREELEFGPSWLWTRSYFVSSAVDVSSRIINK